MSDPLRDRIDPPGDYRPFDQEKWLGDPPWTPAECEAWETAHNHDVRIKCYPEYGCLVTGAADRAALLAVLDLCDLEGNEAFGHQWVSTGKVRAVIAAALGVPDE